VIGAACDDIAVTHDHSPEWKVRGPGVIQGHAHEPRIVPCVRSEGRCRVWQNKGACDPCKNGAARRRMASAGSLQWRSPCHEILPHRIEATVILSPD
jgi:hypothetical protein